MHDIKAIRENPEAFDAGLARRGLAPHSEALMALDNERRAVASELQERLARRNAASKEIGRAKGKGGDPAAAEALMAEVAALKDKIAEGEADERRIDEKLRTALAEIPNLPGDDVPEGKDEHDNKLIREWGTRRDFGADGFEPKQHFEIGEALGLMDFEAAAKMSGARFTVLKGPLARLERALGQFMIDLQTDEHGYTEVQPPLMVRDHAMFGTAQLPKFQDDQYYGSSVRPLNPPLDISKALKDELTEIIPIADKHYQTQQAVIAALRVFDIATLNQQAWDEIVDFSARCVSAERGLKDDLVRATEALLTHNEKLKESRSWLIPTSEVPLTNLVRESIVAEAELPYRYTALTPCFRAEAGAAGRDTRGYIRQHQFNKVELVSITTPEQSAEEHERMTRCAEEVLKRLELPFRTMLLCTGDMGFAARKTYDIEVWLPGQNAYREISSCSNCGDFQARRMDARYRPSGAKAKPEYVHTLNGSGLALGRTLVAVMENYQDADGGIRIPDALRGYMGGVERIAGVKR